MLTARLAKIFRKSALKLRAEPVPSLMMIWNALLVGGVFSVSPNIRVMSKKKTKKKKSVRY